MKTFSRTSLPESLKYNGNIYKVDTDKTSMLIANKLLTEQLKGCVLVEVLARNLRGRENAHGKLYQPTKFIFSKFEQKSYQERLREAIETAKNLEYRTVIARKQDDTDAVVLLEISNCRINDEMDPCYQVSQANNCIAIAVCSGKNYGGSINYVDL